MLILKYIYDNMYCFNIGNYIKADAINIIAHTAAQERNCCVRENSIYLKEGQIPVFHNGVNFTSKPCSAVYDITVTHVMDAWFNDNHYSMDFTCDNVMQALKAIDDAVLLNTERHSVQTPFGDCVADELSTGLKCLLTCLYAVNSQKSAYVNITECGLNAYDMILDAVENKPIMLYTELYEKRSLKMDSEMLNKKIWLDGELL